VPADHHPGAVRHRATHGGRDLIGPVGGVDASNVHFGTEAVPEANRRGVDRRPVERRHQDAVTRPKPGRVSGDGQSAVDAGAQRDLAGLGADEGGQHRPCLVRALRHIVLAVLARAPDPEVPVVGLAHCRRRLGWQRAGSRSVEIDARACRRERVAQRSDLLRVGQEGVHGAAMIPADADDLRQARASGEP
jgi:hypothetical protein